MTHKIVEMPELLVIGRNNALSMVNQEHLKKIPLLWEQAERDRTLTKLMQIADQKQVGGKLLGICSMSSEKQDELCYMIAVEAAAASANSGFDRLSIPALTWGVFEAVGKLPSAIQNLFQQIYTGQFPIAGYERTTGPDIEVYPAGDMGSDEYRCEVWVPIVPK